MDRLVVVGAALAVLALAASAAPAITWSPLYAPPNPAPTWKADGTGDGQMASWWWWKRPEQTRVTLCGMVTGYGVVTLAVGDEGDGHTVAAPVRQPLCLMTEVPLGGGGAPVPIGVYFTPDAGQKLLMEQPNIWIGQ